MKILITGGASGIGSGIANFFAKNHEVTIIDRQVTTALSDVKIIAVDLLNDTH